MNDSVEYTDNMIALINGCASQLYSVCNDLQTDMDNVVCKWGKKYSDTVNSVFLNNAITDYTNQIQSFSNDILNDMSLVVCNCEQLYGKETNCTIQSSEIEKWVEWHYQFLNDKKNGLHFNVFDLFRNDCKIGIEERIHSKLINFLLDSTASHGQGKLFLNEFLKLLDIEKPDEGIWNITVEKGYIDILLYRSDPESIIIIENKSNNARDQQNQLYRYWHDAIYLKMRHKEKHKAYFSNNKNKYQLIYLAPNVGKIYEEQTKIKPIDWDENLPQDVPMEIEVLYFDNFIQKWLDNCINCLPAERIRIKEYIVQYQMLCKTL